MKNLNFIFNLLLFPFIFRKYFYKTLLIFGIFLLPIAVSAGNHSVSIDSVSIIEGNTGTQTLDFTITATDVSDGSSVDFTTNDGTATIADSDYIFQDGNVTFSGNVKTQTISIVIIGDVNIEPDERFTVKLSNPIGFAGGISIDTGTGTIINDDFDNYAPIANDKNYFVLINGSITGNVITGSPADNTADSDPDGDTIVVTSNTSPSNGTLTLVSDGSFTYTPANDYSGVDSFTYVLSDVRDDNLTDTATVTINVNALIAVDDSAEMYADTNTSVDIDVTSNDESASSNSIDITNITITTTDPSDGNVTVDSSTGIVTYTPDENWFGDDTFTYTLTDNSGNISNEATVTVSVISEAYCHDQATELLNATAYGDSGTDSNDTFLTSDNQITYRIYLDLDGILQTDINNTGDNDINFGFSKKCSDVMAVPFGISDDDEVDFISLPIVLESGWYYMAFSGSKKNEYSAYNVTVTLLALGAGGDPIAIGGGSADIVNTEGNFNSDAYNDVTHEDYPPYITTKVSGDVTRSITGVYLSDDAPHSRNYTSESSNDLWFIIMPFWSDSTCTESTPVNIPGSTDPLVMQIYPGFPSTTETIEVPPNRAIRDARFKMLYLDLGAIYADNGDQCILNSATSGNLQGIGQCINSPIEHYEPNFGTAALYRCIYGNGQPCLSSHHGYSCGPGKTDCPNYNPDYDNEYGCLMCTLGSNEVCSSDNFSIRPESYSMDLNNTTPLLTAGEPYRLDANATYIGGGNSPTDGYTINFTSTPEANASYIFSPASDTTTCPPSGPDGDPINITFNNGVGVAVDMKYENVGDVNITLVDGNWTTVDQKDERECVPGSDSIIGDPVGCLIKGSLPHRYIPARFDINATLKDHNSISNFTYLNDTHTNDSYNAMAALLNIDINVTSKTGIITDHYITGCYAQDTDLALVLNDMNITYPGSALPQALTQFLYYNSMEDNGSENSGEGNSTLPTSIIIAGTNTIVIPSLTIKNSVLIFPTDALDGNGTTHVEYKLNFDRKLDLAVNPFLLELTDANITDADNVTGSAIATAGAALLDQNATMYYARTRASKYFYEHIRKDSVDTHITVNIYCKDTSFVNCDDFRFNDIGLDKTDESYWYLSMEHNTSRGDGNITINVGALLIEGEPDLNAGDQAINGFTNASGDANITIVTGGVNSDVNVSKGTTHTTPITVPLEMVLESDIPTPPIFTNEWLIYNKDFPAPPSPFYKVRFIGDAKWTGEGQTGHVMEINASYIKLQRLDW